MQQHDTDQKQETHQLMKILADASWFAWHTLRFHIITAGRWNLRSGLSRGAHMGKHNEKKGSYFVCSSMFFIGKTKEIMKNYL